MNTHTLTDNTSCMLRTILALAFVCATVLLVGAGQAFAVSGSCAATHYNCSAGTSVNNVDGATSWTWTCNGTARGNTNASCSETKPVVSGALTLSPSSCTIQAGASTCTVSASWNTSNATGAYLWDRNVNQTKYTANSSGGSTVWIVNPQTVFDLKNGDGTILDTKTATASCVSGSTGSGRGGSGTCVQNVVPVNGSCGTTHYNCSAGTSVNNVDNPIYWGWACNGSGGGTNASCSETKPPVPPPVPPFLPANSVAYGAPDNSPSTNTAYTYSSTDTGSYCQFSCLSGYTWNASTGSCIIAPDLTVGSVSPNNATAGVAVTLSSTISNIGSASTGASFNNFMQVATNPNGGGTITDTASINMSTLTSGASNTFSKSYTFASNGSYSVRVCADKSSSVNAGVITESNENNNCGAWTNIVVSNATCPNGATNPPTCTTFPPCSNGATNPPTCNIFRPTATLSADSYSIDKGQSTNLNWNSNYATGCTGIGFTAGPSSGTRSTGPLNTVGTQNYQLYCSGAGGNSTTQTVSIIVNDPTVTITATPNRVRVGNPSTIMWNASGVKSCTVSGPNLSSTAKTGSQATSISSQSTYTIVCQTNGTPITKSVIVNVTQGFEEF